MIILLTENDVGRIWMIIESVGGGFCWKMFSDLAAVLKIMIAQSSMGYKMMHGQSVIKYNTSDS